MIERCSISGERFYTDNSEPGKLRPSVTAIVTRTASMGWEDLKMKQAVSFALRNVGAPGNRQEHINEALKEPDRKLQESAYIGSRTHELLWVPQEYLPENLDGGVETALTSWRLFCEDFQVSRVSDEVMVIGKVSEDDEVGYGGTYDAVIKRPNGDRIIIDVKTSRSVHNTAALQLAAYWQALGGVDTLQKGWIVHLNKFYPEYSVKVVNLPFAWEAFKHAHQLYVRLNDTLWEV